MNTFYKNHLILFATTILLLTGCMHEKNSKRHQPTDRDTLYTEAAAMSIHRNDPERALVIIDSARIVGNITWQRAEYLKAVTQYGGLRNMPLARQTCLDLIDNKDAIKDSTTLERVYLLLTSIEYTSANHPAIIRYATEASRLAHALNMPDEVGKMEAFVARSMAQTGRTDEGIERLKATLADLRKLDTFGGVVSYHDASKKLLHILIDHDRYPEMETVCKEVLERLDELVKNPERFGDMQEGFNPAEFIDFARGQMLAFLTTAYARQVTQHKDNPSLRAQYLKKALDTEAEVFKTEWSKGIDCDKMLSAAYHHMGQFDRFDQAMRRFEGTYPDTINPNYLICLEQRSVASKMQGRTAESLGYLERASVIRDSLDQRNQREQLNELATIYHLQEEQLARQQAESDARFYRWLTAAIVVGLLAAVAFAIYFYYKRRETMRKNRVLAREIAEAIEYKEKWEEKEGKSKEEAASSPVPSGKIVDGTSDEELFQSLRDVILRDRLYLNSQLDRQALVDRFGLSKERIGAAFAKGSPYKSLIEFLTDCRLPYAAKLLSSRPDLSIADVARESGFPSADTFGRNFKQKYALTPSQFRESGGAIR
jgi:AraC-like DNA-binding protein